MFYRIELKSSLVTYLDVLFEIELHFMTLLVGGDFDFQGVGGVGKASWDLGGTDYLSHSLVSEVFGCYAKCYICATKP